MVIIERPPILEEGWTAISPDGVVEVKPYQILVFVSVTARNVDILPEGAARIPTILDTGNNHNFSIRQGQLDRWISGTPRQKGWVDIAGSIIPRLAANVWIHPNQPGTADPSGEPAYMLELEEGIVVYPTGSVNPARLPTLGLRALIRNGIKFTMDGVPRELTLESPTT
jgi:hypothetical protein